VACPGKPGRSESEGHAETGHTPCIKAAISCGVKSGFSTGAAQWVVFEYMLDPFIDSMKSGLESVHGQKLNFMVFELNPDNH